LSNSIESIAQSGMVCLPVVIKCVSTASQKAHSHGTIVSRGFDKLIEDGDLYGSVINEENHKRR